jgi:serine/alanine adding enzyme
MKDIYFEKNYGKLYESIEKGSCELFEFSNEDGNVQHLFIKREIPILIDNKSYFDIVTPYGYGGPLITRSNENRKDELVKEFEYEFNKYCLKNNIVSEFVRFHPVIGNASDFKECYDISHIRNTVGTNLKDYDDPFQSEFSKSCKKNIRKALNENITFKITRNPSDVSQFKKIYYSTMKRNEAAEYYYFDDEYFNMCVNYFGKNLVLVEALHEQKTIAMGLYFIYDKTIHIHLSGTLSEYLYLSPAYILRYAITIWGKENGFELIHHGGGRTNYPDDNLYKFKKQFGVNTDFEFYVGKKIWNKELYYKLCEINEVKYDGDYFPAYRASINQLINNNQT